mgnify:FL=1
MVKSRLQKRNKGIIKDILKSEMAAGKQINVNVPIDINTAIPPTKVPETTEETGSLKEVESWLQDNPGIKWSKRKTKAYKDQRKILNQKAVEVGAYVDDKMDNIKIKGAILKAANKKFKQQPAKAPLTETTTPIISDQTNSQKIADSLPGEQEGLMPGSGKPDDMSDEEWKLINDDFDSTAGFPSEEIPITIELEVDKKQDDCTKGLPF